MDIPVYLFTGFLEAGKTKFIQETLEDERFSSKDNTLLLICEEGFSEYESEKFCDKTVFCETIEEEDLLSEDFLENLRKKHKAKRVVIEYNGMWQMASLYNAIPKNWIIYQEFTFANAETYVNYNANMRSLVVDKLQNAELVVFNRYNDSINKEELHKIVRGISRKADIVYEFTDGSVAYDDIEDPLPFDINADIIKIEDRDYAIWYRDMTEEMDKYDGKTVKFRGIVAQNSKMGKTTFAIGRHVMTCCEADISYAGLACVWDKANSLHQRDWVMLTAQISIENHKIYGQKGPVLYVKEVCITSPADPQVATFY